MADEGISPDTLSVTGLKAIENAPDIDTGYDWLTQAYQSQQWSDPQRAKQILTEYGTVLRQKFNKNNIAGLGPVEEQLPYSRENLPEANYPDPIDRQIEKENLWEAANLKRLEITDDPNLLLKKDLLEKYIPEAASLKRRTLKDPGFLKDAAARVALGVISPVTSLFGTGEPQFLKEATNPERDDDFMSELISGAGTVGTAIGLTAATGGVAGFAYLGAGAAGSVKETYQDVKETTGDFDRAVAAASIDAAGQTVGFAIGGRVAGKIGSKLSQAVLASNEALAQGATKQAARTIFQDIMHTAGEQAIANVAMSQGRRSAERVGLEGEQLELSRAIPGAEDIGPSARAAAVGGILGAGAASFGAGYQALAERQAARVKARAETEVAAAQPEPVITTPESRESMLTDPNGITDLALDQAAAELPRIDSEGVAHARETATLLQQPAQPEQVRDPGNAKYIIKTANDDTFYQYEDGHIAQHKTGEGQLVGATATLAVDRNLAPNLLGLKNSKTITGDTPGLSWDGQELRVYSENVTPDLDLPEAPTGQTSVAVPIKETPTVGDVLVSVDGPLYGEEGGKVRRSSAISSTIKSIEPGPALTRIMPEDLGPTGPGSKPRMSDQRLVENKNLPESIQRAYMSPNKKGEPETTFRYLQQPMSDARNSGAMWIEKVGGDVAATSDFLSGPDQRPGEVIAGARQLLKRLARGIDNAEKAEDPISAMKLHEFMGAVRLKLARGDTERGQIINLAKDLQELDPREAVAFKLSELKSRLLKQELASEGLTPDQAAREMADLEGIRTEIENIKANPEVEVPAKKEGGEPTKELSAEQDALIKQFTNDYRNLKKKIETRLQKVEKKAEAKFPKEDRVKYQKLLEARAEVPEKSPDQKSIDAELNVLENKLSKSRGENFMDGWRSYYILNLLADVGTGVATATGNLANLAIGSISAIAGAPFRAKGSVSDIPQNFQQFSRIALQSFPKALRNAFADFMGGYFQKYNEGDFARVGFGPSEGLTGITKVALDTANLTKPLGYVGRFLSALDTFASELGTDAATAIRLMEENPGIRKLKGKELIEALDRELYGTKEFRKAAEAEAQARVERLREVGIKGDAKVILDDIYKKQRPEHIQEELEKWGMKIALRGQQGGSIGRFGKALSELRKIPFAGPAFINFVNAAGNLIAFKVELTPYGFLRPTLLERGGQQLTPLEKSQMYTSAIVGSVIAAGAYSLMQSGKVQINGNGPSNPAEKKRLIESGWKPFSFQVGNKFVSYAEMPFSTILAGVGGYGDYLKYSTTKNKIGLDEASNYIMGASFSSLFASPLTQNASELIEILKQGNEGGDIVGRLENFAKRNIVEATKNAIIPGNRTLRNVTAMFQDPLETRLSWKASVLSNLPWVGSSTAGAGKPALNLFGEPIYAGKTAAERYRSISRFYTQQVNDPAIRFLTDKGYYITDLPGKVTVPDENNRALKAMRAKALGPDFEDIMTESERYKLQRYSGPEIKQLVLEFRTRFSYGPWNETVQKQLSERVSDIRSKWKRQVLYMNLSKGFSED